MRSRVLPVPPDWKYSEQLTTVASHFFLLVNERRPVMGKLQKKIAAAVMIVVATHYLKKWAQS
jgi:hypothetical protein